MKTPFEKEDNTVLITAIAVGAIAAGALAYLYLTESGHEARGAFIHKLKDEAKNFAAGIISDKTGVHKTTVKKVEDHIVK